MRAAVYHQFGKPAEVLAAEDVATPEVGAGQVLVKMILSSIHNHDLITVEGNYGYKPDLPAIGGSEAVGIIEALGEGVEGLAVGQRVSGVGLRGSWAEYFVARADQLVPLPDAISDESAAQLMGMPLSALFLLEFLGAEPGQWIVQNAATGAVAKVLAMVAAKRGIHVVNLVRRAEAIEELSTLGIGNAVATDGEGWRDAVKAIVGEGRVAAVVDGVGGPDAQDLMGLLAANGTFVSFGAMSGKPLQLSAGDLIFKQAVVKGFWLGKMMETMPLSEKRRVIGDLLTMVAAGDVTLQVGGTYALDEIGEAAKASRQSGRAGKILVKP